jgi:hypothetical protein
MERLGRDDARLTMAIMKEIIGHLTSPGQSTTLSWDSKQTCRIPTNLIEVQ